MHDCYLCCLSDDIPKDYFCPEDDVVYGRRLREIVPESVDFVKQSERTMLVNEPPFLRGF